MILCIKHIDIEGPGTMQVVIPDLRIVELYRGEALPKDLSGIDGVITLGGPMNVYEEERYPFLFQENRFLKSILDHQIPVLGICLGSQLIAKSAAAKVYRSPVTEIGFREVTLTALGQRDPLFKGLPDVLTVFQWHEDTFDIPSDGILLAQGRECRNQAFKVGRNVYGFQFHVEITHVDIDTWIRSYWDLNDPAVGQKKEKMLQEYLDRRSLLCWQADRIYENFLGIVHDPVNV